MYQFQGDDALLTTEEGAAARKKDLVLNVAAVSLMRFLRVSSRVQPWRARAASFM
ncbi:hypothetical protein ACSQ76_14760 [Roseovarius sp. B08]|uniref:hypothetical protein n=1 Tax=Roseovarius sp. B08 TaxID=3449223 RepID=UPI003EDC245E